jgi:nucleoside-diphosphate-sugar epimerase
MSNRNDARSLLFGCGDVGRRIVANLVDLGARAGRIGAYVNSQESLELANSLGVAVRQIDLDSETPSLIACHGAQLYYTVPPQKEGIRDERSRRVIDEFRSLGVRPNKVVLISTTGVYGDCGGEWVSERSPTEPKTERGQRRLDAERNWFKWGDEESIDVVVLRAPGIYAKSRLPSKRLQSNIPVVRASECGYTNRIHADDLARACVQAMRNAPGGEIYNASDGTPGKISEYLQAAAQALNLAPLPEISLRQAKEELSAGMLSYLSESRKISNKKLVNDLGYELLYPDFKEGLMK